jgi:DNA-binding SARP family transcriptional activator
VEFQILGPLEVGERNRTVALGGAKQRAVLAILLLHRGEVVPSERLIDELWGEHLPATAAKTLHGYISHLRKALGAGVLETVGHGYRLAVAPDQFDVEQFERLAAEGRDALAAADAATAVDRLRRALGLWRGPALVDFAYEPFAQTEIGRLEDARLGVVEDRIDADLALGRHAEVAGELEALIAEHPYRERLRAHLMLALYRGGRQADALEAFQDARRSLVEELGIEPSRELRELHQAIVEQDPQLDRRAVSRVSGAGDEARPPAVFVGRERELRELGGALEDCLGGHGRLILITGEPGIGKSRLAEELSREARNRGALVLVGRCWEAGGAPAFWPWVQSFRSYVREVDADRLVAQLGGDAADLATILPELSEVVPEKPASAAVDPDGARFRLFHATAEFLRRASHDRPIVIVLDDLHAADTPSLLLLQFLAREMRTMHVLLAAAMRDVDPVPGDAMTAMLAEITREPVTRRISIVGLSEAAVAEYVDAAASEIASAELAATLYAHTEGNPLFMSETVRLLAHEGADRCLRGASLIPQSVRDVIARRLSLLPDECRQLLEVASVLGREFTLDALARLTDVVGDRLLDTLDQALEARILAGVPGVPGRLRFAHVLIRDTLYEGLTSTRRILLHRRAADVLAAMYGNQPGAHLAELAHHSIAGSDFGKGLDYAWRAGDVAITLLAYEESARLYQVALDALDLAAVGDDRSRCELLLSLGEAQARAGNTPQAKTDFACAADIARRLGLTRELARAAVGYGGRTPWGRVAGDDRVVPLLEEGLCAVPEEDVELRVRLLARLAGALREEPSRDRRDRLSREAVELARLSGDPGALVYALDGRPEVILAPDNVAECLALSDELCEVATSVGDRERMVHGHMGRFVIHVLLGNIRAAKIDLAAMNRIATELKQPVQLWQSCVAHAMLALGTGELGEAEALIPKALALGARPQADLAIPAHGVQWYTLCEFRATFEDAEQLIRGLVDDYPTRPVFRCVLTHLHAQLGRTKRAKQALDDLARAKFSALPFDAEWLYGISLLAETSALLRDPETAAVLYQLLKPWAALNVADHPEGIRGSVSRYLGLLAMTLERHGDAETHYQQAIAMNTDMGARPWLAHTQHDYARMLLHRSAAGDREQAHQLLPAASSTFDELGMNTWAQRTSCEE